MRVLTKSILSGGVAIALLLSSPLQAKLKSDKSKITYQVSPAVVPLEQLRVHDVGNIWLSITNYGILGSFSREFKDQCTGLPAPSCQFPGGDGIEYLFQGALWVGAVVNDTDTLVSVGHDGWENITEFDPSENGAIISRTIKPDGHQRGTCFTAYSNSAISELDYIAIYHDTLSYCDFGCDPYDGQHRPLLIEVSQKSYSWSYEYANDFVLIDFLIKNIGNFKLKDAYIGLYLDLDINNPSIDPGGYTDDIVGFKFSLPSAYDPRLEDTVNLAWGADNNGLSANRIEGNPPVFRIDASPTGVLGTRVVKTPNPDLKFSFNWWVSNGNPSLDFGPWRQENYSIRPQLFPPGVEGTPSSDRAKYFMMSHNEIDYDQLFAALNWTTKGWRAPNNPSNMGNIADGYDTRYLLSFGPFNIDPAQELPLTVALVAGEDFHVKPTDMDSVNIFDSASVYNYYNRLDFTSLVANAQWAEWVYDNPVTVIYDDTAIILPGDGVPDFKGPPPPPFPKLTFETSYATVKIKWNGKQTETYRDPFTTLRDFEGYRIFASWNGLLNNFFILDSFDKMNYKLFYWDKGRRKWRYKLTDLSADSLITLFKPDDPCGGVRPCPQESLAFCSDPNNCNDWDVMKWTKYHPYVYNSTLEDTFRIAPNLYLSKGDSIYFDRQDWNRGLLPIKTYKQEIINGTIGPEDDRYHEYEYVIDNLNPNEPLYFAVTAFDFGDPITKLAPLETSVLTNSKLVYPRACLARPGDVNGDGQVLLSDVVNLINIRFGWPPNPDPVCLRDVNGDGLFLFSDIIYLVNYLFKGGPNPPVSGECCLVGN